jgi:hypothetical protein
MVRIRFTFKTGHDTVGAAHTHDPGVPHTTQVGAIRIKEGGEYRRGGRTSFPSGGEVRPQCEASPRRRDSFDDEFTLHRPPSPEIVSLHTVSRRHRTTRSALRGLTVMGGRSPLTRSSLSLSARRWGLRFMAMAQRGQQGEATLVLIARNHILTATRYSRWAQLAWLKRR